MSFNDSPPNKHETASLATELKVSEDTVVLDGESVPWPRFFLNNPQWGMSQKLDGHRVIAYTYEVTLRHLGPLYDDELPAKATKVQYYNRDGGWYTKSQSHNVWNVTQALQKMSSGWTLDGELVDDVYYVFDLLRYRKKNMRGYPLYRRQGMVDLLIKEIDSPYIKTVPLLAEGKSRAFQEMQAAGAEGVMFKKLGVAYKTGRNTNFIKCKFKSDVDCYVTNINVDGKSNLILAMWDGKDWINVGKCSSLTGDGPSVKIGDVVKVNILYSTNRGRLVQPTLPRIRTDKQPHECGVDQLEKTMTRKDYVYDRNS